MAKSISTTGLKRVPRGSVNYGLYAEAVEALDQRRVALEKAAWGALRLPQKAEHIRYRKYAVAVHRRVGFPIGKRAFEAAQERFLYDGPYIDGRVIQDGIRANISPNTCAGVIRVATAQRLWTQGYGSEHSPKVGGLASLLMWGKGVGTPEFHEFVQAHEHASAAIYRSGMYKRSGALQPDWAARLRDTLVVNPTGGWEGVKWVRLARFLREGDGNPEHIRLVCRALSEGAVNPQAEPLWRLRRMYGTPRATWYAMGATGVPKALKQSPQGDSMSVKKLHALTTDLADGQQWDDAVVVNRVWGPLAGTIAGAVGLHDAAQVMVGETNKAAWAAYRGKHSGWLAANPLAALPVPLRWEAMSIALERASEDEGLPAPAVDLHPASLPEACLTSEEIDLLRSVRVDRESIPPVMEFDGTYTLRTVERGNPLALKLGELTSCCQRLGYAADSCVRHGVANPDGGFWAIQDKAGRVVAQSWVWRSGDVVTADNIECSRNTQTQYEAVLPLYRKAADSLVGKLGIREVNVGVGYSSVNLPLPSARTIARPPRGTYSDTNQGVLRLSDTGARDL